MAAVVEILAGDRQARHDVVGRLARLGGSQRFGRIVAALEVVCMLFDSRAEDRSRPRPIGPPTRMTGYGPHVVGRRPYFGSSRYLAVIALNSLRKAALASSSTKVNFLVISDMTVPVASMVAR